MSYSPGSGLSSSHSIPATPSASLAASSAAPARSAPPVDSRMESIASTAFAHPDSLSTRLRVCSASLRVCLSCRSSHSRNGSGNASHTRMLGQDAGLLHSSANCMDGSSLFVLAWPYARGWVARCLPDESRTSTSSARRPTTGSLPAFARSAEQRCRPRARPRRTGRPSYAATRPTSKRFPGNGSSAARSSENRPRSSVSLRQCGFVASSRHRSGSPALKFSRLHTLGRGTNSLRRTMPTLDSTAPFS